MPYSIALFYKISIFACGSGFGTYQYILIHSLNIKEIQKLVTLIFLVFKIIFLVIQMQSSIELKPRA